MTRRLLEATLGALLLLLAGCQGTGVPAFQRPAQPVGLPTVPPIRDSINHAEVPAAKSATARVDPGVRPAGLEMPAPAAVAPRTPDPAPVAPPPAEAPPAVVEPPAAPAPAPAPAADPSAMAMPRVPLKPADPSEKVPGRLLGLNVARVGNVDISWSELNQARKDLKRERIGDAAQLSPVEERMLARAALDRLIDRTLLVEEARRALKSPKQWEAMMKMADERWAEHELPPLMKRYEASNPYELKVKMEKKGLSLDRMHEIYRNDTISTEYLMMRVHTKLKPSLPELQAYYDQHRAAFDRPAQVKWHEILVKTGDKLDAAAARKKAELALDRLRHGEAFEKVAKALSDGHTADQGGAWATEPGSHAVDAVNQALASLGQGQVSPILEAPDGLRILRVDGRRPAGPAPFPEVQKEIFKAKFEENYQREVSAFVDKLRKQTLIQTIDFGVPEPGQGGAGG